MECAQGAPELGDQGKDGALGARRREIEWPTWGMLVVAYGVWIGGIALYPTLGVFSLILICGVAAALHASLQHECLHGHPTRSPAVNEALVFTSLTLLFPFRRFKELHLRHHDDERLTDPYDDPETWYVAEGEHAAASPAMRRLLALNATLGGRLLIGPWLGAIGIWRNDLREARKGRRKARKILDAYVRHAIGVSITLSAAALIGGVHPLLYVLCVSWTASALLMIRTYVEHRAERDAAHRTAIVDAEPFFALLFLNNNLHAVHHERPRLAWYRLPAAWRRDRERVLADNGGYYVPSYAHAFRTWFLRRREPVAHPFMRRAVGAGADAQPPRPAARAAERGARPAAAVARSGAGGEAA